MSVGLLYSYHRHVSATHVANFRAVGARIQKYLTQNRGHSTVEIIRFWLKFRLSEKSSDGYKILDVTYGCMEYGCVEYGCVELCILVFFHLHTEDGHMSGRKHVGGQYVMNLNS
jgi:hypothetical protein